MRGKKQLWKCVFYMGENSEIVTEFQRIINRLERNENIEDVLEEFAKKAESQTLSILRQYSGMPNGMAVI